MRIKWAGAGIGIGFVLGVVGLSSPAAAAANGPTDDPNMHISPRHAAPGSTVTVSTRACGSETYGKGESEAGGKFHLLPGDQEGVLTGEFKVPGGTEAGGYTVTLKCPPRVKITGTYWVGAGNPSGAVDAGFGAANDKGTQLALGAVLLAGAAAGGVIKMRRSPTGARV
ncbi:sortase [Streptomyces neyagawaensis]|uniref:sortase n=1 Tax=Streptomyces neyagawaensis TaxID=42238 RepID=UPI00201D252F|nr:sortase [Streptomyces neyagawaensis]MCL6733492.1 sortase [Streptomyces neyagawaensis]MDE1685305.1 sortase [Streptomyces neyagawaensis]